jgi:hypothetical protein
MSRDRSLVEWKRRRQLQRRRQDKSYVWRYFTPTSHPAHQSLSSPSASTNSSSTVTTTSLRSNPSGCNGGNSDGRLRASGDVDGDNGDGPKGDGSNNYGDDDGGNCGF